MNLISLDFETFYSQQYSLSKITTEEYIRHEEFEVIGVGVAVNDDEPVWYSGPMPLIRTFLGQFDWDNAILLAHNAMFDAAIASWHFGIKPKRIADTLSMARALHGTEVSGSLKALAIHYGIGEKGDEVVNALGKRRVHFTPAELARYGEYCKNDVALCRSLFEIMAPQFSVSELRLIDLTIRMFSEPVLELDLSALDRHMRDILVKKSSLMEAISAEKADLMSNPKFADILRGVGVEPPTKTSPTTGKETYAFSKSDEAFVALQEHENPLVQALVAARLGVKSTLEETRTQRFIDISKRGTLPIPLRYYAAHTGRWGGDDKVNMQNLPRTSPLKYAIKAPAGYVMVDSDSSQIEARTLAWLAEQNDLVEAFEKGEDVYKIMASSIYGKPVGTITKDERFVGKTTILGCLAEGTLVLTDRGWVAIEEVTTSDQLWDGGEWVCHQGLVEKGTKETLSLCGLWLTPDHKILCGTQWLEAQYVVRDSATLYQALDTGAANWLYPDTSKGHGAVPVHSLSGATVEHLSTQSIGTTLRTSKAHDALHAGGERGTINGTGSTYPPYQIRSIGSVYSTAYRQQSPGATTLALEPTRVMVGGVSPYTSNGAMTAQRFCITRRPCRDGTTQTSTWTGQTTTGGTNPAIYGLFPAPITLPIEEKYPFSRRNLRTYDIAFAGPRNRYTVATSAGPIIVHNCGYGMGAAKFRAQLKNFGVNLPAEECERIIHVYRSTYPRIPELWKQAGQALEAMIRGQTAPVGRDGVVSVTERGILLPNGLHIKYPGLRKSRDEGGKIELVYDTKKGKTVIPNRIYGGKVIENLCQALARIVVGEQMLLISRKYKAVMTVHDAVACIVPEHEAERAQEYVELCMRLRPSWAPDLPLNCEAGYGPSYGEC